MKYLEKLKDPRWQKMRLKVMERDEWTCQRCCDDESTLYVHHLSYSPQTDPWDYPIENFITVCEICHQDQHEWESL
jgi:5-methylcytosine-specific restriction endonuclease McrA